MKLISATMLPLVLTATMISLNACSLPVSLDTDCAWAKSIRLSEPTKTWLAEHTPWPGHLRVDLIQIARHNEKYGVFCR